MPGYAAEPETADDKPAFPDGYPDPASHQRSPPPYNGAYETMPAAHAYDQDGVLVPVDVSTAAAVPEVVFDDRQEMANDGYRMYNMAGQHQVNHDNHHSHSQHLPTQHATGSAPNGHHYPHHHPHHPHPHHHHHIRHMTTRARAAKRKRVITFDQRKAANIRERRRMLSLNDAFDLLRRSLPTFSYEKKLSRIETLRLALTYMAFMTDILNGADPKEVRLLPTRSTTTMYRRPSPPGVGRSGDGGNTAYMYYV